MHRAERRSRSDAFVVRVRRDNQDTRGHDWLEESFEVWAVGVSARHSWKSHPADEVYVRMPDEQRRPTGTIEARPNPVTPGPGGTCGATMLTWTSAGVEDVEVRVGAPSGPLFASGGASGTARTGEWVSDRTTFFLQDVSDGRELSLANTLSSVCVRLSGIGRARPDEHWRREFGGSTVVSVRADHDDASRPAVRDYRRGVVPQHV